MNDWEDRRQELLFIAQVVISVVVLLGALFVIFFSDNTETVKWAIGVAGLIVGYWLREALIILIVIFLIILFIII